MLDSYFKDIYKLLSKKHPNSKIYIISDHHFYHSNIIHYEREEFSDVLQMNEHIITEHNSVINDNDIVIFLGDFSFRKTAIKDILSRMNGHKYLLLGNHDQQDLIRSYGSLGFEGIFTNPVKINDDFLSHQPLTLSSEDVPVNFKILVKEFSNSTGINYHGHIHTKDSGENPFVNVCCEARNYKPLFIGYTEGKLEKEECPLIINSSEFEQALDILKREKNFEPNFVIADYIYSMMLDAATPYVGSYFVYGSFSLYKKYGYISNFSDLDVGLVYDENISKNRNYAKIKEVADTIYEELMKIDNINLSFYKRIASMCIFEALYTNRSGNYYNAYYDSNLVPLNIHRDSDFITSHGTSLIEKVLAPTGLLDKYKMPQYETRFLSTNGDIANLILQYLFQQGFNDKKATIFRKLKYVYHHSGKDAIKNHSELEDIMVRLFIRNILFLHTTRRSKEIDYIKASYNNIEAFLNKLPVALRLQMEEILRNPNSLFSQVYQILTSCSFKDIPEESKQLIKTIKGR